jgi:predicted metal-binding membrane protein
LMGLPFVAGVMNLDWVAALTAAIIIEKFHPSGVIIGKSLGAILIFTGLVQIATLAMK